MKILIFASMSITSLALCLIAPILYLLQKVGENQFKSIFLAASVAWFIFAILWNGEKKKTSSQEKV